MKWFEQLLLIKLLLVLTPELIMVRQMTNKKKKGYAQLGWLKQGALVKPLPVTFVELRKRFVSFLQSGGELVLFFMATVGELGDRLRKGPTDPEYI